MKKFASARGIKTGTAIRLGLGFCLLAAGMLRTDIASAQSAQIAEKDRTDQPVPSSDARTNSSTEPLTTYRPITGTQRVEWFFVSSVGPESLAAGLFSAGFGTAIDKPVEYGPSWPGFAKRYGMRLTGVATGNAIEAGTGALWGEDPRYFRASGQPFGSRLRNIAVLTFMARRPDGHLAPAYARYLAIPGNNFLSLTWRADSEATTNAALTRTILGFAARMGSNTFQEFWPDARKYLKLGRK
ncbi:MAG TPA: hypothetical protein VOA64_21020 [Candidatus Dormibacteraeota bacterium]|nr:hypothetical protein [Candidatus Dormibacteraeota bacterium]